MRKIYSKTGELLNIICSVDDLGASNRVDVTDPEYSLQLGLMQAPEGHVFKPHAHLDREVQKTLHIVEAFVIMKGWAIIRIFDTDLLPISEYLLRTGDVTILLNGGHSLEIGEDCKILEFKTGPYEGRDKDKIWIE